MTVSSQRHPSELRFLHLQNEAAWFCWGEGLSELNKRLVTRCQWTEALFTWLLTSLSQPHASWGSVENTEEKPFRLWLLWHQHPGSVAPGFCSYSP